MGPGINSLEAHINGINGNVPTGEIIAGSGIRNSAVVSSTTSSTPTGVLFDASVTISNQQSTVIPNNYNQKVTVDSQSFAKYENGNLANVE